EYALVCLPNGADSAAGIQGKAIGGGTGVSSRFGNHVGLDGVESGELVNQALAAIVIENDSFLEQADCFLRGSRNLIYVWCIDDDLLFDDVAMRSTIRVAVFVGLRIDHTGNSDFDFGCGQALLIEKVQN